MDVFEPFQKYLVEVSGLFFTPDRCQHLLDRVRDRMKVCKLSDPLQYLHFLKSGTTGVAECKNLLDHLTIGETFFFRNQPQFEALQNSVLPQLFQKKKSLSIWCAGCSTGEEPYSVAMLLHSMLPDLAEWEISILATDINRHSLDKARAGMYGARAVQLMPQYLLDRYFAKQGQQYRLSDDIKRMVTFQYHNLATEPFNLPAMLDLDILFCRNVTIYFNMETLKRIVSQFSACLVPGSIFLIGHAETLWGISEDFDPIEFPRTFLYEKRPAPKPAVRYIPEPLSIPISIPLPDPVPVYVPPVVVNLDKNIPIWLEKGLGLANSGHYEEAMGFLKKVVEHDNLQVGAYHVMGVVLVKLKRYHEAIAEFRRALYCDPEFAVCHFHLGNVFRFLGENADAKKEYDRCLKILVGRDEMEGVPFSEGLTVGILAQAASQAQNAVRES
jgi:chemotaxis protein methyltransferase CheR